MEEPAAAAAFPDPPEDPSPSPSSAPSPAAAAPPPGPRELAAAMEAVERDVAAISDSYASLFASLRVALANVRTHSRTRNWTKLPRLLPPSTLRSLLPFLRLASFAARSLRSLIYCSLTLLPQNWILKKKVTSTSAENMECLGDVVGRLQESGEDVCLRICKFLSISS